MSNDRSPSVADRIAPALPQFEESEQRDAEYSSAVAPDPTADRVQVALTCSACGARSDSATTMLRPEPTGRVFVPGAKWPMRQELVNGYWYFDVRAVTAEGPMVVLDGDCCRECGADLWFELTFETSVLARARQTQLTAGALDRCHVCTTRTKVVASALAGGEATALAVEDTLQLLRTHLLRTDVA